MTARAVMVLGCTSGAGKSWLTTALCRWYARQGLRVAPFKAQNMSKHARVVSLTNKNDVLGVASGLGEIGSAQYFQALAARAVPEPRMNPVLLKPEGDTRSQVVLMGAVRQVMGAMPWRERSALLWPVAREALRSLREDADLLVIEGAGSPAEINLAASDYVNTFTALEAQAACLVVADIDRGGAFAHLYGTHALMDAGVRDLLRGFVLNKFRGDAALLAPGPEQLLQLTGVPTVAVLPMWREHGLPEEDAVPDDAVIGDAQSIKPADPSVSQAGGSQPCPVIVVITGPHASNLDEFEPLRAAGVALRFSRDLAEVARADWLIVPGSKHSRADLAWLRRTGLDAAIARHVAADKPLLAVCGGLQMLGDTLDDPLGLEGGTPGRDTGLGLLALTTRFEPTKQLTRASHRLAALRGPWAPLAGQLIDGYEIHLGRTAPSTALPPTTTAGSGDTPLIPAVANSPSLGWQQGPVLALYLHGLFENSGVVQALFGRSSRSLDSVFDGLADHIDTQFAPGFLMSLLSP